MLIAVLISCLFHAYFMRIFPELLTAHQLANTVAPAHFYRAFCPGTKKSPDYHMFETDPTDERCPKCNTNTRFDPTGKPNRQALYYKLDGWVKKQFEIKALAKWMHKWREDESIKRTRGELSWAWDGSILAGGESWLFKDLEVGEECVVLAGCADATVVSHAQSASVTPYIFENMCLPGWLRKTFDTKFVGAMFPDGMHPSQLTQLPLVEMFARLQPGPRGNALQVDVTAQEDDAPTISAAVRVLMAWLCNDLKGYAKCMCAFQHPAIRGGCMFCKQYGVKITQLSLTVMPGACSHLPLADKRRKQFQAIYASAPAVADMIEAAAPVTFTKTTALRAGKNCAARCAAAGTGRGSKAAKDTIMMESWFKDIDVWSEWLDYFNKSKQNIIDPAHEIANLVLHTISSIGNLQRQILNAKRRAFARQCKQLADKQHPPWQCSDGVKSMVDLIIKELRLPKSWPLARYFFDKVYRLGCAELLLFAGPLGVYMLEFMDIEDKYKQAFITLFWLLEKVQAKTHTTASIDQLDADLIDVLSTLEVLLPISWCTSVAHTALHLTDFIRKCGPFKEFNMLVFERMHTMIKRLIKGKRNLLASFHNHYTLLVNGSECRALSEEADDLADSSVPSWAKTFQSSIAGAKYINYELKQTAVKGSQKAATLRAADYDVVRDQWEAQRDEHPRYSILREGYRREIDDRDRKGARDKRKPKKSKAQLPDSAPEVIMVLGENILLPEDVVYFDMVPDIMLVEYASINETVTFRNVEAQRFTKTDNSAIKGWYVEPTHKKRAGPKYTAAYGWIKRIFLHSIHPGCKPEVMVDCDWLDMNEPESFGGLPRGRKAVWAPGFGPPRIMFLKECAPYNIALLSDDPLDPDCSYFKVIDREGKLGSL